MARTVRIQGLQAPSTHMIKIYKETLFFNGRLYPVTKFINELIWGYCVKLDALNTTPAELLQVVTYIEKQHHKATMSCTVPKGKHVFIRVMFSQSSDFSDICVDVG